MTHHLTALVLTATGLLLLAYAVATWLDHALSFAPIVGTR